MIEGVCPECYEKAREYFSENRHKLCHVCFRMIPRYEVYTRWIGDQQYFCCNDSKCVQKMKDWDLLHEVFGPNKKQETCPKTNTADDRLVTCSKCHGMGVIPKNKLVETLEQTNGSVDDTARRTIYICDSHAH